MNFILAQTETIPDTTGEVDVSTATIWERVDNMIDGTLRTLPNLAIGIVVFALFVAASKLVAHLFKKYLTGDRESLGVVFARLSKLLILLLGLMVAMAIIAPSVSPGDLLATLGVGGVAIGFAFKDILQNFLAGVLILIRQPFQVGDQIVVGSHEGTVESIETRSTFIKTYDGRQIVVPNGEIYMNAVIVNTAYEHRRSQYDVGIGCNDSMADAREIMLKVLQDTEGVVSNPAPQVLAVALADSANILRARWWTKPQQAEVMKVQDRVIEAIESALTKNAIDMPYPTQVLLFHDQTVKVGLVLATMIRKLTASPMRFGRQTTTQIHSEHVAYRQYHRYAARNVRCEAFHHHETGWLHVSPRTSDQHRAVGRRSEGREEAILVHVLERSRHARVHH